MGKFLTLFCLIVLGVSYANVRDANDALKEAASPYKGMSRVPCLKDGQYLPVVTVMSFFFDEEVPDEVQTNTGSGFVFREGYYLTAHHTIANNPDKVVVSGPDGYRPAVVVASDPINDMALLKADTTGFEPLPMYLGPYDGVSVWTVGYIDRAAVSFSGAVIRDRNSYLEIAAPAFPGMSGGPVIACGLDGPMVAGLNESFNYYMYEENEYEEDGKTIIERSYVNSGTSNAPSGQLLDWFASFAIAFETTRTREQEE